MRWRSLPSSAPQNSRILNCRESGGRIITLGCLASERRKAGNPGRLAHDGRMDDRADEPGRQVQVLEVQPGTAPFEQVLILAARVLAQDRYLASRIPHALESHVLAAFDGSRCAASSLPGPGDRRRGGQARGHAQ